MSWIQSFKSHTVWVLSPSVRAALGCPADSVELRAVGGGGGDHPVGLHPFLAAYLCHPVVPQDRGPVPRAEGARPPTDYDDGDLRPSLGRCAPAGGSDCLTGEVLSTESRGSISPPDHAGCRNRKARPQRFLPHGLFVSDAQLSGIHQLHLLVHPTRTRMAIPNISWGPPDNSSSRGSGRIFGDLAIHPSQLPIEYRTEKVQMTY